MIGPLTVRDYGISNLALKNLRNGALNDEDVSKSCFVIHESPPG